MDVPLLRTLSFKSKLGFGKYADMTVYEIINLDKSDYLRWIYYNVNGISFNNEVLFKIRIFYREKVVYNINVWAAA